MRALRVWLMLVVAMVANGAVRALVLEPALGVAVAQVASVAMAIGLILLITHPFIRSLDARSTGQSAGIAAAWVGLTVVFELGFGRYVTGASWGQLIANYNLLEGRLWPLVLAAISCAPFLWRPRRRLHFAPHGA